MMKCIHNQEHKQGASKINNLVGVLLSCIAGFVFKGCMPENIVLPGEVSPGIFSSLVSVPETFENYFSKGISFDRTDDEVEMVFKIDADWMLQVVDDAGNPPAWCSISADIGSAGLHKVKVRAEENMGHVTRSAHIYLMGLDNSRLAEVVVRQDGVVISVPDGYTDYFAEDLILDYWAGEAEVVFSVNVDWPMQFMVTDKEAAAWCSVEQSSSKDGLHKVKVHVTKNNTYGHRSATLRLMCDTVRMGDVRVIQTQENAILLGKRDYDVSADATTIEVALSANVDFEYRILDADWVREQQPATRGLTAHKMVFEVDANPSHKPREAQVVFRNSEHAVSDTLTLVQKGLVPKVSVPEGYTDYFTQGLTFGPMPDEIEVIFQINVDWSLSVDGSPSWLGIDPTSGKAGLQTVTVRAAENSTTSERTATIHLLCDTDSLATIEVKQEKKIIKLSRTTYDVSYEGGSINVELNANIDFEYKILDADWVREQQPATRGLTAHKMVFEIDANPSVQRDARIVFYNSEYVVSDTLTVAQDAYLITTGDATNVTASSATLGGTVNSSSQSLTCGIIYGTTSALSSASGNMKATTSKGNYSVSVTGLKSNTTYYYRAYGIDGGRYKYGEVRSFTTEPADMIDLGLSVKWASCNVGAESPEEYGDYFAWGETEPKSDYSSATYKWCNGSYDTQTKYCTSSSYGTVDNKTVLDPEDDAATANWGGEWRMPTEAELVELRTECTWEWTTLNGVNGYEVTGPNGNSIFFPAAGYRCGTDVDYRGSRGHYWSATLGEDLSYYAYDLYFNGGNCDWSYGSRDYGRTVRPVSE